MTLIRHFTLVEETHSSIKRKMISSPVGTGISVIFNLNFKNGLALRQWLKLTMEWLKRYHNFCNEIDGNATNILINNN